MELIDRDVLFNSFNDCSCECGVCQYSLDGLPCGLIENAPTVEAIPKDQYEARLRADKMATFKEFRDKLSKWMFHNSESVCGNSMIDIDYLEGYMDELLYELGIYEVDEGDD